MEKVEIDKYLNTNVRLKRIGYVAVGKVQGLDPYNNYNVQILEILDGVTKVEVGSTLNVSKHEMPRIATVVTSSNINL